MRGHQFSRGSAALIVIVIVIVIVSLSSFSWVVLSVKTQAADEISPSLRTEDPVESPAPEAPPPHRYIEIVDGCNFEYLGECVLIRAGPGIEYKITDRLRKGIVLKVGDEFFDGTHLWYEINFDEPIRYPERVTGKQYVAAENVRLFFGNGVEELGESTASTKRILVDRSEQKLYAYDGESLFMQVSISTGIELTPTPRGNFIVYKKTPTRYMQGPLPEISEKYYDLPGVPWNLYFTEEGGVIHGAYWHESFGRRWSNGCVNLPLAEARTLYEWADVGTPVLVRD